MDTQEMQTSQEDLASTTVGFIGFGNMAQAIARGFIHGNLPGSHMYACAKTWEKLEASTHQLGVHACQNATEVVQASDIVFIAVKPGMVSSVVAPIADELAHKIVISVAWGVYFADYERMLAPGTAHLSAIPNIPVSTGEGAWVCENKNSLTQSQQKLVHNLLALCGIVVETSADLLDVAGTVTSCAPAFAALFVEALADAAVKYGLPRALSYRLAAQMIAGSGKLLEETGEIPAQLKDEVCSPGGATIRGICALEDHGMRSAVIAAMDAIEG